jgi:hypothetical protein
MSFFSNLFGSSFGGGFGGGFTGGSSILPLIATGLTAATSLYSALQGNEKVKQPSFTTPSPIEGPKGPAPDPTSFKRPTSVVNRPQFLSSGLGLTPIQEASEIATGATQGESKYRSPEAIDRYKYLTLNRFIKDDGSLAGYDEILPTELDFVKRIMGKEIRSNDTRGFLGALTRT